MEAMMVDVEELKARVQDAMDQRSEELVGVAQQVLQNPEPGYREQKTSRYVQQQFERLGLPFRAGLALTGVKAVLQGGAPGPTVAVLGELDSLVVFDHPHADPQTGAAHACGHHAQIGMLLGVATALVHSGVMPHLSGRVVFFAVPAEELIEVEYRDGLRRAGKIEFLGGKPELLRLGELDDVDMAMLTHTTGNPEDGKLALAGTNNGLVVKRILYVGRGAHAGASPHLGVNALNAAMLGLQAIHALRETFREDDTVRVHPIITKGGEAVSAVPSDVRLETFVRAKSIEAVRAWDTKVDRALRAGALAVGAKVRITTIPGYLPLNNNPAMAQLYRQNAVNLVGEEHVRQIGHRTASTDMGDLSQVLPAIQPYAGGAEGVSHGADYLVHDYVQAVINPAKVMAMTVIDLLAGGAAKAKEIKATAKLPLAKEGYLNLVRGFAREEEWEA
ncbi:MAG: amidohydrolase [Chloroflexi bacterium]|nr:amidohydrolase [Chloroflexota bacterium]